MKPSEMTDKQLNQAIVEKLGWTKGTFGTLRLPWLMPNGRTAVEVLPNYPGDIAAAFDLPLETNDEKKRFAIELAKIVIPDINIGTAGIVYETAFATARQRSEAWLTARGTNKGDK